MLSYIYVFIGGGLGSISRYGITRLLFSYKLNFPMATFLANVLSCIILGVLLGYILKNGMPENQKLLLLTGFCGGFSTFSTFSAETFQLMQNGMPALALLYIALSVLVCLFCIYLGMQFIS